MSSKPSLECADNPAAYWASMNRCPNNTQSLWYRLSVLETGDNELEFDHPSEDSPLGDL